MYAQVECCISSEARNAAGMGPAAIGLNQQRSKLPKGLGACVNAGGRHFEHRCMLK